MNEKFVDGFFKEYFDLGSRLKERFTQQFDRTDELSDANHKLNLQVKILKDKIDELEHKTKKLEMEVVEKNFEIDNLREQKSSNVKSFEIRRLENENRKMNEQIKTVESRFAKIITEHSRLVASNKELAHTVLIHNERIKSLEEKLKVSKKRKSNLRSSVDSSRKHKFTYSAYKLAYFHKIFDLIREIWTFPYL